MFLSLLLLQTAYAECEKPINNKTFSEALNSFGMGFVKKEMTLLDEKSVLIKESMIPCLSEPISQKNAYDYHLMVGLYHEVKNREELANQSFQIAKHIQPDAGIDYFLYPEGHVIHDQYAALPPAELALLKRAPTRGSFLFDGREIPYRPQNSPTIFQIVEDEVVLLSAYVNPADELPTIPETVAEELPPDPIEETTTELPKTNEIEEESKTAVTEENPVAEEVAEVTYDTSSFQKKQRILWGSSLVSFTAMATTGLIYYRNGLNNPEIRALSASPNATLLLAGNYLFLTTTVIRSTRALLLLNKHKKQQKQTVQE